ncbi:cell cycle checkpoint control protein RAD9A [Ciona intestinalis]
MKCVLPGANVKLFAKAIHCLAKLGHYVYFEPLDTGLALKTVNSSRSAYVSILFMKPMFQVYNAGSDVDLTVDDDNLPISRCKVALKTLLQVFKSLANIERSVETCDINLDGDECRLVFQLKCKHGITKTHHLTFQECESLQAVFAKDLSPNVLKCDHKVLSDVVINFSSSLEEITMLVSPCKVVLRSYSDDESDEIAQLMKTEVCLNPEEFSEYQIGVDTDVTFCLKDVRAILAFCEVAAMPVNIHFEVGGKPIIFSLEHNGYFRANFVIATIATDKNSQHSNATANFTTNTTFPTTNKRSFVKPSRSKVAPKPLRKVSAQKTNAKPQPTKLPKPKDCDSINSEHDVSPEIPLQGGEQTSATRYEGFNSPSPEQPCFKSVKTVFFAATQTNDLDHTVLVLAPDSDNEDGT